jgi:hypothetical protein
MLMDSRRSIDRRRVLIFISLALVPLITAVDSRRRSALADEAWRYDAIDQGRLDIRRIAHQHREHLLVHDLETFKHWSGWRIKGRKSRVWIWFKVNSEESPTKRVVVDYVDGNLVAYIERYESFDGGASVEFLRFVELRRASKSHVNVSFEPDLLSSDLETYEWMVETSYSAKPSGLCWGPPCRDAAPGNTWMFHDVSQSHIPRTLPVSDRSL